MRASVVTSLPVEIHMALTGAPVVGQWDVMLPLLTVDDKGFPNVCLLSRAELDVDDERVYAVAASGTTVDNLWARGRATLIVVGDEAAVYCKLAAESLVPDGDWLAVTFRVESVKRDGNGIPLRPPRYLVAESLATEENWARSAKLLDRMKGA